MNFLTKENIDLTNTNYVEVSLFCKEDKQDDEYSIFNNIVTEKLFYETMQKMNNIKYQIFFQKQRTEYTYLNMDMIYDVQTMNYNVYSKSLNFFEYSKNNNFLINYIKKNSEPIYKFPSTDNINNIKDTTVLIFKITNRLYVNFEVAKVRNKENPEYRIYINYNHGKDGDIKLIENLTNNIIKNLVWN